MLPQNINAVFTEPVLSFSSVADVITRKRTWHRRRRRNAGHLSYHIIESFLSRMISVKWWIWQATVNTVNTIILAHHYNPLSSSILLHISRTVTVVPLWSILTHGVPRLLFSIDDLTIQLLEPATLTKWQIIFFNGVLFIRFIFYSRRIDIQR